MAPEKPWIRPVRGFLVSGSPRTWYYPVMPITPSANNGTILQRATMDDLSYIDHQSKKDFNAIGFIPKTIYESIITSTPSHTGRHFYRYSDLVVLKDNDDHTGFCYLGIPEREYKDSVKVFQIVVREDARRWHRAAMMLEHAELQAVLHGKKRIEAKVALDLEANAFWIASGYTLDTISFPDNKRGRPIAHYSKDI